jgi:predicted DNA-binding transcriptional regulator
MLQEKLRDIENRLSAVESNMSEEKIIVLRDISYEDAKKEIKGLFLKGQTLYYSDISHELGISLRTVVTICDELYKNGEIAVDG